jgi:hypothetical protein
MRYFATADDKEVSSGKESKDENMTEVEEQILGNKQIGETFFFIRLYHSSYILQPPILLWKHLVTQKPQETTTRQDLVNI